MEVSMVHQLRLVLNFFLFGLVAGAFYDAVRIVRICIGAYDYQNSPAVIRSVKRLFKCPDNDGYKVYGKRYCTTVTVITDVVYSLVVGTAFIIYLYHENYCIFRWYLLLGALVGFAAYSLTVGRLVVTVAGAVIAFVKVVFRKTITLLLVPIKYICRFFLWLSSLLWNITFKKLVDRMRIKRGIKRTAASKSRLCELLKI